MFVILHKTSKRDKDINVVLSIQCVGDDARVKPKFITKMCRKGKENFGILQ